MKLVVFAFALGIGGLAHADRAGGAIVFARGGAVFEAGADGTGAVTRLADLPEQAAEVRWMETTRDGRLVIFDYGPFVAWLVAPTAQNPVAMRGGPCVGRARPAANGERVVCPGTGGLVVTATAKSESEPLAATVAGARVDEASFRGESSEIAGLDGAGVIGFDPEKPTEIRRLARHGAPTHLLIAPDGAHAVAMFGAGDDGRIRSFLLDGDGVSRQLGGPGLPTLWSWDSSWVLFQEGDVKKFKGTDNDEGAMLGAPGPFDEEREARPDPFMFAAPAAKPAPKKRHPSAPPPRTPDNRACVGRATGGEVKCWDDFVGQAFSPDSTLVLLKRGSSLYIGKIAGVHPDPPVKILDDVEGAATWIPAPLLPAQR